MTSTDWEALRRLAEPLRDDPWAWRDMYADAEGLPSATAFVRAASPVAVLALLDALKEARADADLASGKPVDAEPVGRILWNKRGEDIDEIVLHHPSVVHVEQLDNRCWWIGIYLEDEGMRRWSGHFHADSRGRMSFTEQENDGILWDEDDTHEPVDPNGGAQ